MQVGAIHNVASGNASPSDTFDILLQPAPDAGFSYIWTNLSSSTSLNSSASTVMAINGSAPCCIPISGNVSKQILADNSPPWDRSDPSDPATWRPQGATPTGSFMGSCNLAARTATFTWYKKVYNVSASDGAGNAQVLVMNATGPAAVPPPVPGKAICTGHCY